MSFSGAHISRTNALRRESATSAAAHPWCPSPIVPPPVEGWIASG